MSGWTSCKDVILWVAGQLTVKGGTGAIVEYFGEGADNMSATGKGTVCNMGAEIGATCSIFAYDEKMSAYLKSTGRAEVAKLADGIKGTSSPGCGSIWLIQKNIMTRYWNWILTTLEPYVNGPFTPDLATPISKMAEAVKANGWPAKLEVALIGSCTNSSYEDISRSASIVKDAVSKGLKANSEFTITPGSGIGSFHYTKEMDLSIRLKMWVVLYWPMPAVPASVNGQGILMIPTARTLSLLHSTGTLPSVMMV